MYSIDNNKIKLVRGNTFECQVGITLGDESYTPSDGDQIVFTLKQTYASENILIEKTIPSDSLILFLEPADTSSLKAGEYVYSIDMIYASGDVDTFIQGTFTILGR